MPPVGHFQDRCPQQPQQQREGEGGGARAFVAIENEGDDMGFAFPAWDAKIKEDDVMEEVNLRQSWTSENGVGGQWGRGRPEILEERWEDKGADVGGNVL